MALGKRSGNPTNPKTGKTAEEIAADVLLSENGGSALPAQQEMTEFVVDDAPPPAARKQPVKKAPLIAKAYHPSAEDSHDIFRNDSTQLIARIINIMKQKRHTETKESASAWRETTVVTDDGKKTPVIQLEFPRFAKEAMKDGFGKPLWKTPDGKKDTLLHVLKELVEDINGSHLLKTVRATSGPYEANKASDVIVGKNSISLIIRADPVSLKNGGEKRTDGQKAFQDLKEALIRSDITKNFWAAKLTAHPPSPRTR